MRPDEHAPLMLRLLQGAIEYDDRVTWLRLLHFEKVIRQDFARIGLELVLQEADGYAFLRQPELEDESGEIIPMPRLVARHRLGREITMLCVLLRERLEQFESSTPDSDKLLLTLDDLYDLQRPFSVDKLDERSLYKKFDQTIKEAVKLGFLRPLIGTDRFEVRFMIKARISAEQLLGLKNQLLESIRTSDPSKSDNVEDL
ncbi:MAG: hypothetical protein RLZZ156_817 [Deinococcota bacterium]|jgi:hypothetical protein